MFRLFSYNQQYNHNFNSNRIQQLINHSYTKTVPYSYGGESKGKITAFKILKIREKLRSSILSKRLLLMCFLMNNQLVYLQYLFLRIKGIYYRKQSSKQKMPSFTFDALFKTTTKGLPNLTSKTKSFVIPRSYTLCSIAIQSILFLFFLLYFIMSIYRVAKKIKNSKFKSLEVNQQCAKLMDQGNLKQQQRRGQPSSTYPFDQESQVDENEKEKQRSEAAKQKQADQKFNNYHDKNEIKFITLDHKCLNLQCLLISFIICNNSLISDLFYPILLVATFILFILFNIKKIYKPKLLKNTYIWCAILGFFPALFSQNMINI